MTRSYVILQREKKYQVEMIVIVSYVSIAALNPERITVLIHNNESTWSTFGGKPSYNRKLINWPRHAAYKCSKYLHIMSNLIRFVQKYERNNTHIIISDI